SRIVFRWRSGGYNGLARWLQLSMGLGIRIYDCTGFIILFPLRRSKLVLSLSCPWAGERKVRATQGNTLPNGKAPMKIGDRKCHTKYTVIPQGVIRVKTRGKSSRECMVTCITVKHVC